jgi:glucose uptake protein
VTDDFSSLSGLRVAEAIGGGCVFNVANIGLCKSIELMGLAVAFPLCIGMALVVGTLVNYAISPSGNIPLLIVGLLFGLAAVCGVAVVEVLKQREQQMREQAYQQQKSSSAEITNVENAKPTEGAAGTIASTDIDVSQEEGTSAQTDLPPEVDTPFVQPTFMRKMIVTCSSGALMSFWSPLATLAISSDVKSSMGAPLTPYGEYFFFCLAILLSTACLIPAILACPIEGGASKPMAPALRKFWNAPTRAHVLCLVAGVIWGIGGNANSIGAASSELSPATSYGIGQAAPVMAIFWGLFLFHEFAGNLDASSITTIVLRAVQDSTADANWETRT